MDINIPAGVSELTYPEVTSVNLNNYNHFLNAVIRFEVDESFKAYIPYSPFSEFSTLDAGRQYKIDAISNFIIHTD